MVLLHYKKTEHNQFLYETKVSIPVEQIINELVEVNNLRLVIDRLAVSIEDLASHGVMRPEELRGLSGEDTINFALETLAKEKMPWAKRGAL